jgi:uncharacterized protein YndB with AHSA1/START domain
MNAEPSEPGQPEPPALPAILLEPWPVIIAIAVGWLIAAILAFTVAGLHEWRPIAVAGLGGRCSRHVHLLVAASRRAPRFTRCAERSALNPDRIVEKERAVAQPLLQTQIDINAPVDKVWALIADFSRMPQWSPQCRLMKAFGPLRQGTRTINVNRRNFLYWPTTSTVTEVIPEKKLAFRVNTNNTVWTYELEPTENGTRVVESRHAENGVKPAADFTVQKLFGGVPNFERELIDGMNTSLARIKAAAES